MTDTSAPVTPSPGEAATPHGRAAADPLEGDWAEGLPGPVRAHGIAPPRRLSLEDLAQPGSTNGATGPATAADAAYEVAAPGGVADVAAAEQAATDQLEVPSDSAPTPWSEPVAGPAPENDAPAALTGWDQPAAPPSSDALAAPAPAAEWQMTAPEPEGAAPEPAAATVTADDQAPPSDAWSAAPPEPVQEWQAEAAPSDWQESRKPDPQPLPEAAGADWSSLRSGPDWSASTAPEQPQQQAWEAAPPAAEQSEWAAAPPAPVESEWTPQAPASEPEWSAPPAAVTEEWRAPVAEAPPAPEPAPIEPPAPPAPKAAWNQPAVGASALEQLDSEPPEPEPGAAQDLFGSIPAGASLGAADDELGPPEELASPEEVLRPVAIDHDDPDLPEPTGEPARTRAQPLAAWKPTAVNAMEMQGEHRVAVHTRGGRTLRGTMRDIDLSKSQFPLIPQGGGEPEPIYRAEVKAIFFMLAPGEPPHAGDGAKVRVTFADGRVIEGFRDGVDAKHGFFLVPLDAARTNTRRIYVEREATSDIKDG